MERPWDIPQEPDVVIGRFAHHDVTEYDMVRRLRLLEYFEFLGWFFVTSVEVVRGENWIFRKG